MAGGTFLAARNPRHRTAALALYRALLRACRKVIVSQEGNGGAAVAEPLARLVRKGFVRNKPLTSPRLTYAAMAAGYRMWDKLCKARDGSSSEYRQVLNYAVARSSSNSRRSSTQKTRTDPPLLTRISQPGQLPRYSYHFERPAASIKGERKVPILSSTADGFPYLRLSGDQPHCMSQSIGKKMWRYRATINALVNLEDFDLEEALAEDEWDDLVALQSAREGLATTSSDPTRKGPGTYVWTVQLNKLWQEYRLDRLWQDWTARGAALHRLVEEQRALAVGESTGHQGQPQRSSIRRLVQPPTPIRVSKDGPFFHLRHAIRALPKDTTLDEVRDIFTSPSWAAVISASEGKLQHGCQKASKQWQEKRQHLYDGEASSRKQSRAGR